MALTYEDKTATIQNVETNLEGMNRIDHYIDGLKKRLDMEYKTDKIQRFLFRTEQTYLNEIQKMEDTKEEFKKLYIENLNILINEEE